MHLHSADTAPQSPHRTTAAITADFAVTWPAVETPLRRYLGSIGVNRHDIDDLVQETASRAIRVKVPYNDASDLRAWSFVVARRLLANLHRSRRRQVVLDGAHRPDPRQDDLMAQVEDRLIIEKVVASAANLTVAERLHLAVRPANSPAERNRANVARHRARQHLRRLVGPLAVAGFFLRRRGPLMSASLGIAAVALPLALLPSQHGSPTGTNAPHRTDTRPTAATAFSEPSRPTPLPAPHPKPVTLVEPARPSNITQPPAISFHTEGPVGSNTHATVEGNDGRQPLVCTSGTIIERRCVALPPGIEGRRTAGA